MWLSVIFPLRRHWLAIIKNKFVKFFLKKMGDWKDWRKESFRKRVNWTTLSLRKNHNLEFNRNGSFHCDIHPIPLCLDSTLEQEQDQQSVPLLLELLHPQLRASVLFFFPICSPLVVEQFACHPLVRSLSYGYINVFSNKAALFPVRIDPWARQNCWKYLHMGKDLYNYLILCDFLCWKKLHIFALHNRRPFLSSTSFRLGQSFESHFQERDVWSRKGSRDKESSTMPIFHSSTAI